MEIKVTARGLKESERAIDHITHSHDEIVNDLLHQLGLDVVDEARQILSNNGHIDTGGLLGSIKILEEGDKYIEVGSDAPHAGYVEFGRGPIKPINAVTLRFFDKKTGKLVFTKYVGPTEPSPFLQPAVENKTRRFSDVYSERVDEEISESL